MNLSNILNEIEKTDPEFYERTSERRDVIKNWSRKIGMAALPFALGGLFKKAYGRGTDAITDVLNFALTLEYLEAEFYTNAYAATGLIPSGAPQDAIRTIRDHEQAHVNFLRTTIQSLGATPVTKPTFDFTGGNGSNNGPFADVFSTYATFLAVAQAFEDTGVRAYKGGAAALMSNNAVLTAALQIHSVEARHAAHIRQMRKNAGQADVKPWITMNMSGINSTAVQPIYNGEDNTTQAGVPITGINGKNVSANAASEAFDEPLDAATVLAIVDPFIV
jgi:hypothetical protein